jgi:hypothetical protein
MVCVSIFIGATYSGRIISIAVEQRPINRMLLLLSSFFLTNSLKAALNRFALISHPAAFPSAPGVRKTNLNTISLQGLYLLAYSTATTGNR